MLKIEVAPKSLDKNFGIEIHNHSAMSFEAWNCYPAAIIKHEKMRAGKFFVQCWSRDYIFLESWQDDENVVLECAEFLERFL
jgi:hypothetical protein